LTASGGAGSGPPNPSPDGVSTAGEIPVDRFRDLGPFSVMARLDRGIQKTT
jgi:hypothetical protein